MPNPLSLDAYLQPLLPPYVKHALATEQDWLAPLAPDERTFVADAVPYRRQEFAAGRSVAKRLLAEHNTPIAALPSNPDRTPQWPSGCLGSISHCKGRCWVAIASTLYCRGLGIDVERRQTLDDSVAALLLTPDDRHALAKVNTNDGALLVFSAKECVHKTVYPALGLKLDFQDVTIQIDPDLSNGYGRFTATLLRPRHGLHSLHGKLFVSEHYVFTAIEWPMA